MGLDPHGLKDRYADYEEQMKAHTLINRAYCIDNPRDIRVTVRNAGDWQPVTVIKAIRPIAPKWSRRDYAYCGPFIHPLYTRNILWRPCAISMKNWVTVFGVNMGSKMHLIWLRIGLPFVSCHWPGTDYRDDRELSHRFNLEAFHESSRCTEGIEEIRLYVSLFE